MIRRFLIGALFLAEALVLFEAAGEEIVGAFAELFADRVSSIEYREESETDAT